MSEHEEEEHPIDRAFREWMRPQLKPPNPEQLTNQIMALIAAYEAGDEQVRALLVPPRSFRRYLRTTLRFLRALVRLARARMMITVIAIVTFLAGSFGVAYAAGVFRTAPPTDRRTATCYASADLGAADNHYEIGVAQSAKNPSQRDAANAALELCATGWQQGLLTDNPPSVHMQPGPQPWDSPVPPLIACVLDSGKVGVFPGTNETCQQLDLPVAEL
jgi:hypothetical protein